MTQHVGDLIIACDQEVRGQVIGTTYVRAGAVLIVHGQLAGGMIIEEGGRAIVYGQVSRNVVNMGELTLHGQVSGRIVGNPPNNPVSPDQVVGTDLEVPCRGQTVTSSHTF